MKNVAILISEPPHGTASGREALDMALALSDINHVSVFFMDEGIFHLLPNQLPETILARNYIATFNMLELYDIDDIYVCDKTINANKFHNISFNLNVKIIDSDSLNQKLAAQDVILRF